MTHGPHMNLCELITWLDNNIGVMSEKDSNKGIVHHQTGPQGICKAFRYPDWLCDDEVGRSIPTCHACGMSRRNQEDPLPGWAMP